MQLVYRIFLWLFVPVFCLLYFLFILTPGIFLLQHEPQAIDFLALYAGAKLVFFSTANLYNFHAQLVAQQLADPVIKNTGRFFLPFLNPPFVGILFLPVTIFGLMSGYVLFLGCNLTLLVFICFISRQMNRKKKWYVDVAIILGILTSFSVLMTLLVGQLSIVLCAIFFFAWVSLTKKQEYRSGLILSLLLIKPQFFLLPFLTLLVQRRSKLTAGYLFGTFFLLGISYLSVGWDGMNKYLSVLISDYQTGRGYDAHLMAQHSLQTIFLMLFHTQSLDQIRFYWFLGILCIIIPTLIFWSKKFPFSSPQFSLQLSLLIIATLLVSPHTQYYDLSLLSIVGLLLLSQMNLIKHRQKKLFITLIILSYCIPWVGYFLFIWSQEIWVIVNIIFLVIFWLILSLELGFMFKSKTIEKDS